MDRVSRATRHVQLVNVVLLLGAMRPSSPPRSLSEHRFLRRKAHVLPAIPQGWPFTQFEIGMADDPGDATALRAAAPFGLRYQYLSGGVNTGSGWTTWNPDGSFVNPL